MFIACGSSSHAATATRSPAPRRPGQAGSASGAAPLAALKPARQRRQEAPDIAGAAIQVGDERQDGVQIPSRSGWRRASIRRLLVPAPGPDEASVALASHEWRVARTDPRAPSPLATRYFLILIGTNKRAAAPRPAARLNRDGWRLGASPTSPSSWSCRPTSSP